MGDIIPTALAQDSRQALLKRDEAKISKSRKPFRAALNTAYLEKLLRGNAVI